MNWFHCVLFINLFVYHTPHLTNTGTECLLSIVTSDSWMKTYEVVNNHIEHIKTYSHNTTQPIVKNLVIQQTTNPLFLRKRNIKYFISLSSTTASKTFIINHCNKNTRTFNHTIQTLHGQRKHKKKQVFVHCLMHFPR